MRYTITVAKSNRGSYHISTIWNRMIPLCGATPPQRRRQAADDTEGLAEMARKWDNTVHADLRCQKCDDNLPETT